MPYPIRRSPGRLATGRPYATGVVAVGAVRFFAKCTFATIHRFAVFDDGDAAPQYIAYIFLAAAASHAYSADSGVASSQCTDCVLFWELWRTLGCV